jgi:hypothetical protein
MKIDGCFVINLDHRTDRWQQFESYREAFTCLGVTPERRSAILGKALPGYQATPWFRKGLKEERARAWAGKAGCTLSHVQAIQAAKERGWQNVLILEDDIVPSGNIATIWADVSAWLDTVNTDWVAVYLYGHHPQTPGCKVCETPSCRIYELSGAVSLVAYLINLKHAEQLLRHLPQPKQIWQWTARYKTIDRWFARYLLSFGRIYACVPTVFLHAATPSDATTAGHAYEAPPYADKDMPNLPRGLFESLRVIRRLTRSIRAGITVCRYLTKRLQGL